MVLDEYTHIWYAGVRKLGIKRRLFHQKYTTLFTVFLNHGLLNYFPHGSQSKQKTQSFVKIVSCEERRHEEGKDTNVRLRHLLIPNKKIWDYPVQFWVY